MIHKPYILPEPQSYTYDEKTCFPLHFCTGILIASELSQRAALLHHASLLQQSIREMTAQNIPIVTPQTSGRLSGHIFLGTASSLPENTYELTVNEKNIRIEGAGPREVLWGVQTLRQIISQEGSCIHGIFIHDFPAIAHRGFYRDATRGRIPDLAALKRLADQCSYYKINELQFYVEHTYLFKDNSEIWRDETPLTAQEIMEFDQYCQLLGIDLIPSLSTFGHLYKLLGSRTFSHFCELEGSQGHPFSFGNRMAHHTINASDPEALELIKARIDEYMSLFSSKYFNICADETFDIGRGKTRALVEQFGREEVYIRFVKELCRHVVSRGKIPMFWGDIIVSAPEKLSQLPEETICLNWGYAPNQDDCAAAAFHAVGARQYMCPGVQGWHSLINVMSDAYENISRMCRYAHQYDAPGVLNTDWGDLGHPNHPDFSLFGMICGAAFSWNTHLPDFNDICRQVSVVAYGDFTETIMDCIAEISTKEILSWQGLVYFKEDAQGLYQDSLFADSFRQLKKEMLSRFSMESYQATQHALKAQIDRLSSFLIHVPAAVKYPLTCLIHAASGQLLLNAIALHLWQDDVKVSAAQADQLLDARASAAQTDRLLDARASAAQTDRLLDARASAAQADRLLDGALLSPSQTAAYLETWFMSYKDIWRAYGKEADLYRLQDVINWYGDFLRDMDCSVSDKKH